MLLILAEYLGQYQKAFLVFQYLTLRGILAAGTALAISLLVGPVMIRRLNYYQVGQAVRDDGPKSHLSKSGTPTMGGALILVAIAIASLLWGDLGWGVGDGASRSSPWAPQRSRWRGPGPAVRPSARSSR